MNKALLSLTLLPLFSLAFVQARADQGPADLEKQSARENQWTPITRTLPNAQGDTKFLRTEAGHLRLSEMASVYDTRLNFSGRQGEFRAAKNADGLAKACRSIQSSLDYELAKNNRFTFSMVANPLNAAVLKTGLKEDDDSVSPIETKIAGITVEPSLSYIDGAIPLTSPERLAQLDADLKALFVKNKTAIEQTGTITSEWRGMDDLVCDLALGQVKWAVQLVTQFEAAQLRREEVISARQIEFLSSKLAAIAPVTEAPLLDQLMAKSAHLGVLLNSELGGQYDSFMQTKFNKFYPEVIQTTTGSITPLTGGEAHRVARKLDNLSVGRDINQSKLQTEFTWQ